MYLCHNHSYVVVVFVFILLDIFLFSLILLRHFLRYQIFLILIEHKYKYTTGTRFKSPYHPIVLAPEYDGLHSHQH